MSIHNQEALPPSTSGSGPTMHSTLRMLPMALLPLSNQRRSRHIRRTRRHSGRLCRLCILLLHSLCSLRSLWRLRTHSHRIPARAARR
jgi:hypothetical protein